MNLEAYQEFHKVAKAFANAIKAEKMGVDRFDMKTRTTENKIIPEEEREILERNANHCLNLLPKSTIFELDEDTAKLCAHSKIPKNRNKYDFLPHDPMFIDFRFTKDKFLMVDQEICGMLVTERPLVNSKDDKEVGKAIGVYSVIKTIQGYVFLESVSFFEKISDPEIAKHKLKRLNLPSRPFVMNFITNLLNFINDPEVSFITHKRDTKNQERRTRRGKMFLPESKLIKITGTLKIYIDKAKQKGGGWHYNFRFPVRSHIRHYRDEAGNVIKEVKIPRFYKGQGITIDRAYEVKNETEEVKSA